MKSAKKPELYQAKDYKSYIRDRIQSDSGQWGMISKLAEAAGCQRSYLSRVLNSEVHLTADHIFGLSQFWGLSERESEFFLALHERDRAATLAYRKNIEKKLVSMRREVEDLKTISQRPHQLTGEKELMYYSSWHFAALHIIVSIPQYRTTAKIAARLQLDTALVEQALQFLETQNLVHKEKDGWHYQSGDLHVSKDSPLVSMHHGHWRQKAVMDAQKRTSDSIHYTVIQSLDAPAWQKIRQLLLKSIEEVGRLAGPAKEEKLIAFNLDLFEV